MDMNNRKRKYHKEIHRSKKNVWNKDWLRTPLLLSILLLLACLAAAWLAVHGFYISMCLAVVAILGVTWAIYKYMQRTDRIMERFVWAIRHAEFTDVHFCNAPDREGQLPIGLLERTNEALAHYRMHLQQLEGRLHYFQALGNHLDTALVVYDSDGTIFWMNDTACRLLATAVDVQREDTWVLKSPKTIDDLRAFHAGLPDLLRHIQVGSLHILPARYCEEQFQLALTCTEFILQGRCQIIASLKNIHAALDSQETLAWQKLIRVLTHEIMNSMTPIISLSELLTRQMEQLEGDEQDKEDMRRMLATIVRRGQSLTHFVDSYRKVSHLPQPVLEPLHVTAFLEDLIRLMQTDKDDIRLVAPVVPLAVYADKGQIEQVLINLITNAREHEATRIVLTAGLSSTDRIFLRVSDNGCGIAPEALERIFVPFFTTKPGGSGIGLALSRQIMLLHQGTIEVSSQLGAGSTFTLLFPYKGNTH